jgi:hypothetical protein
MRESKREARCVETVCTVNPLSGMVLEDAFGVSAWAVRPHGVRHDTSSSFRGNLQAAYRNGVGRKLGLSERSKTALLGQIRCTVHGLVTEYLPRRSSSE